MASSIQPFKYDLCCPVEKFVHLYAILGYPIVLDMSLQFCFEDFPDLFHGVLISDLFCPLVYSFEFRSHGFRSCFQFGYYPSCLRFAPVERKPKKVECALFHALRCCSFVKGHQFCLIFIELKFELLQPFQKSVPYTHCIFLILTADHSVVRISE